MACSTSEYLKYEQRVLNKGQVEGTVAKLEAVGNKEVLKVVKKD